MLALGVSLLVSVAATPPPAAHAAEALASTYEQAACDAADGGECADELLLELLPPPAAILDCQSPFVAAMIGSCDLPTPTIPNAHVQTVKKGGNGPLVMLRSGSSERHTIVSAVVSVDAALIFSHAALAPPPYALQDFALASTSAPDAPRSRLDRPPRA
jgi:hypothetical protein